MWLLSLLACGPSIDDGERGSLEEASIFAVGDSIMAWFLDEGRSIPQLAGAELGASVYNAAVSGSLLLSGNDAIPGQYQSGSWDTVVLDGGGNDVNDLCGCGDCDEVLDDIIDEGATEGVLVELVDTITADGAVALIAGYYGIPDSAESGFDRCVNELDVLSARQAALAAAREDVLFVDPRGPIDGTDLRFYDDDHVHPSMEGAALVASLLADAVR